MKKKTLNTFCQSAVPSWGWPLPAASVTCHYWTNCLFARATVTLTKIVNQMNNDDGLIHVNMFIFLELPPDLEVKLNW